MPDAVITSYSVAGRKLILNDIESISNPSRRGPGNYYFTIEMNSGKVIEANVEDNSDSFTAINTIFTALTSSWEVALGVVEPTVTYINSYRTAELNTTNVAQVSGTYYINPDTGSRSLTETTITTVGTKTLSYLYTYVATNTVSADITVDFVFKGSTQATLTIPSNTTGSFENITGYTLDNGGDFVLAINYPSDQSGSIKMSPIITHLTYEA